ncbi:MAG: GNAT family N-acetyltransferase [Defluviitaleaceae bacterium]|nr:GNAT family N-acetyltransferase [Defluviitaleaceae bacterium]
MSRLDAYFLSPKISLPVLETSGELRVAEAADMPLVREWIEDFYTEILHTEPPELISRTTESPEPVVLFVWQDVRSVAMGMLAESEKSCRINLVYVAPEFRGRGYGRAIVAALARKARENKRVPILYAARKNLAAVALYKTLGFEILNQATSKSMR